MALVLTEKVTDHKIGIITLNHPQRRNALCEELINECLQALEEFRNESVPAVIIRAAADSKVWSAGHDINELPQTRRDPLGYNDPLERLLRAVEEYPGPVIAMVQGGVWGGACDLVLTCDIVIGDHTATFAITPAKLGLPYNAFGIMHFINRLGLNIAKEMFFTADPVGAERALQIGLLNHLKDAAEITDFTLQLAERMASRSTLAIAVIKEQFRVLSHAYPISPDAFERIQGLRRHIYDSNDYQEGIRAFIEKRNPVFRGE